jgi:hypothetical protein
MMTVMHHQFRYSSSVLTLLSVISLCTAAHMLVQFRVFHFRVRSEYRGAVGCMLFTSVRLDAYVESPEQRGLVCRAERFS